ncbi:hypothetical protein [Pseudoduganella lutea]|uniref:Uncharacterized protein n=1 Tax=Pseudoduganella lutea TaxID=321985 RepID=A0A4P6L3R2_9BURK|nr:hypothetical protein [Pseudoduganella lutea]QBE66296.1 hypothetical protein EWM63_27695 [Pseudoduganella lutea]
MLIRPFLVMGVALLLVLDVSAMEGAAARTPVEQFAPLLRTALDSPDGTARGMLTGGLAAAISRQYQTSAPIHIDVSTIVRYRQQGCARLRVEVAQDGVRLNTTATSGKQHLRFELNYCRDGLPPRSLEVAR